MTIKVYEEFDFSDVYNYCYDSQTERLLDDVSEAGKEEELMDLINGNDMEEYIEKQSMYDFIRFEDDYIREKLDLQEDEDDEDDEDEDNEDEEEDDDE